MALVRLVPSGTSKAFPDNNHNDDIALDLNGAGSGYAEADRPHMP